MVCCAVNGCNNYPKKKTPNGVSFHKFPKDPKLKQEWFKNLKIKQEHFNRDSVRVCSNHFTKDDFERDFRDELMGMPKKRSLRPGAIPFLRTDTEINNSTVCSETDDKNDLPQPPLATALEVLKKSNTIPDKKCNGVPAQTDNKNKIPSILKRNIQIQPKTENRNTLLISTTTKSRTPQIYTVLPQSLVPVVQKKIITEARCFRNPSQRENNNDTRRLIQILPRVDNGNQSSIPINTKSQNNQYSPQLGEDAGLLLRKRLLEEFNLAPAKKQKTHKENVNERISTESTVEHEFKMLQVTHHQAQLKIRELKNYVADIKRASAVKLARERKRASEARRQLIILKKKLKEKNNSRIFDMFGKSFTKTQIKYYIDNKQKPRWGETDLTRGINLYQTSKKAYDYLRVNLKMPFPAPNTLMRWKKSCHESSEAVQTLLPDHQYITIVIPQ